MLFLPTLQVSLTCKLAIATADDDTPTSSDNAKQTAVTESDLGTSTDGPAQPKLTSIPEEERTVVFKRPGIQPYHGWSTVLVRTKHFVLRARTLVRRLRKVI